MHFGTIDIIILIIMALSGLIAFYRGFLKESLGLGVWLGSGFASIYGYPYVSPYMAEVFSNQTIANIVAGILIFLVLVISGTIIVSIVTGKVRESVLNGLDRIFGLLFGFLRGYIIIVLLYVLMLLLAPDNVIKSEKTNFFPCYVQTSLDYISKLLPADIETSLDEMRIKAENTLKKAQKTKEKVAKAKEKAKEIYNQDEKQELDNLIDKVLQEDDNISNEQKIIEETSNTEEETDD